VLDGSDHLAPVGLLACEAEHRTDQVFARQQLEALAAAERLDKIVWHLVGDRDAHAHVERRHMNLERLGDGAAELAPQLPHPVGRDGARPRLQRVSDKSTTMRRSTHVEEHNVRAVAAQVQLALVVAVAGGVRKGKDAVDGRVEGEVSAAAPQRHNVAQLQPAGVAQCL